MSDLLAARGQMAISLGFHILFAVAGMAMPLLMVIAEARHLRTGNEVYRELARRWAKGTAILFAVGAVSGTVLSFELGLLWPTFMEHAGPIIGMPFSLEGFAFFIEAIFLGIYLYGWDKIAPKLHLAAGVIVAVSGLASGVFVTAVNGWMNTPAGFDVVDGQIVNVDVWAGMFNPAFPTQAFHMAIAAYSSVAFAVMGIHAYQLVKRGDSELHRRAFHIAFFVALIATPLQILSGDLAAKHLHEYQPSKLAAAEALFKTQRGAPLAIGGWPDEESEELRYAIEIPYLLSILAAADPDAEVVGLDKIPDDEQPPVAIVHIAFQIMVACGMGMLGFVLLGTIVFIRKRDLTMSRWFLWLATATSGLGLIALEAGWTVTEVGRQPWIIRGYMKVADAVTPMPNLVVTFTGFTLLYLFLGVIVVVLLRRHVIAVPVDRGDEE